jgi:hypothetical protein
MFVLALNGREDEGLYAVENDEGDRILYLFKEEDDAERFAGLLEADDFPQLTVIEVDDEPTIKICEENKYNYVIIDENDLVIPPRDNDLF